jgi:hypothetical protein
MKKFLIVVIVGIVLIGTGFFIGRHSYMKGNIAAIDIVNQSGRSIMTATVNHEKGSAIAANIKKNRSQRVRFFTHGPNRYSLKITFDNNQTIYSAADRDIRNGEAIREIVSDSTMTAKKE